MAETEAPASGESCRKQRIPQPTATAPAVDSTLPEPTPPEFRMQKEYHGQLACAITYVAVYIYHTTGRQRGDFRSLQFLGIYCSLP